MRIPGGIRHFNEMVIGKKGNEEKYKNLCILINKLFMKYLITSIFCHTRSLKINIVIEFL
jgi:hypothetical protein